MTIPEDAGGCGNKHCYAKRMIMAVVAAAANTGGKKFMSDVQKLDEIAAKAEQVKTMIGLTHQKGVSREQYDAVLYIVSDYLIDIIKLAESGRRGA